RLADGTVQRRPDLEAALRLYRRLLAEFDEGETRYHDDARRRIADITADRLSLAVASVFLPGTEARAMLGWQNIRGARLALYAVDLTRDVDLAGLDTDHWLDGVSVSLRTPVRAWNEVLEDPDLGPYEPGSRELEIGAGLDPGAYLLVARAGALEARELVLVSDAAVLLKSSTDRALAFFGGAFDGTPIVEARVSLWERWRQDNTWRWRNVSGSTSAEGVALLDLTRTAVDRQLFVAAATAGRQAFALLAPPQPRSAFESWRLHMSTDRPAYRPEDTVQWKLVARRLGDRGAVTPAGASLYYRVQDPMGATVQEGDLELNEFGSAWGEIALSTEMPLGQYNVHFWTGERRRNLGASTMFVLEEYRLPEFSVGVTIPEVDGRRPAFRLGERVPLEIDAAYLFGGPVAGARVEVVVEQRPFYHRWTREREYPWYYDDASPSLYYPGSGQVVFRQVVQTDADGIARLELPTSESSAQDLEYRVEARVTDASRREEVATETVRVTRSRYAVFAEAKHNLYRPGDRAEVSFHARDANGHPVQVSGTVRVSLARWREVWLD
ncbi:MAG: MG2 domain-containing protein, partial [Thermoanaerobaculia bacterium]|nr:MG2 domain-containing protein [Thermoanaerobaculia bacterium]